MKRFLLATLPAVVGFNANVAVTNFNGLTGYGFVECGNHHEETSFQLDTTGIYDFSSIHAGDYRYDSSVGFFDDTGDSITKLTKIGGSALSLDNIGLGSLNDGY